MCEKTVSIVSPSAQKCIDNFPPPLLSSVPRDSGLVARKTGCPLSLNLIIINSATLSHSPCGSSMQVEYHFFSDPSPRTDQRRGGICFATLDTSVALALHSRSLSSDHHMMSLKIDMQKIRPLNCNGSPILVMNSWTLLMSCNVVNPGKYPLEFHRLSVNRKVLFCGELLNQLNFSSQTVFNVGF